MKLKYTLGAALLALLTINSALAADIDDVDKRIRASLSLLLPNLKPDSIAETPVPGLYEVTFGARLVYVSADGRFLLQGRLTDLETRTQITEDRQKQLKQSALAAVDESKMIIYGDDKLPYTITVFTDIDCGYCRKLHSEIDQYNAQGIRVRYMAYPRAGLSSQSARDAENVWCADNPNEAMTIAKHGGKIPAKTCDNPVAEEYRLGQAFGINGTPALVLDDGEIIPGYVPPKRLALALSQRKAEAKARAAMREASGKPGAQ